MQKLDRETARIMAERFGKDTLIALATEEDGVPYVQMKTKIRGIHIGPSPAWMWWNRGIPPASASREADGFPLAPSGRRLTCIFPRTL